MKTKAYINTEKCIGCGHCVEICHKKAPILCDENTALDYNRTIL